jgi:hypothetical protein
MMSIGGRGLNKSDTSNSSPENDVRTVPKHPQRDLHSMAPARGKIQRGYFYENYSSRFFRSCTAGAVQVPRNGRGILTMPHFVGQPSLKIIFRLANSNTFPNLPMAMASVSVAPSYSAI